MSGKVGVVGLGIMGSAYAANLLAAGFKVSGFDLSPARRAALAQAGGAALTTIGEVARECSRIVLALPSSQALRDVARELAVSLSQGAIIIETSTISLAEKHGASAALAEVATLLDCPVSGTGEQARAGDLVIFGSGRRDAFERCHDIFAAISRKQHFLGDFGAGMQMKLLANHLVTIHNVAAGEALAFARRAGLDASLVLETLSESAATSRMLQVRGPLMVRDEYDQVTATVTTHLKDLDLIREMAALSGAKLPLFEAAGAFYVAAADLGYAQCDTAVVCRVSAEQSERAGDKAPRDV